MSQVDVSSDSEILVDMLDVRIRDNPYNFAMYAYAWGEGDLERFDGPRKWQRDVMEEVSEYLRIARKQESEGKGLPDFFRNAIASGRGPGKSALLGMLAHWFISTRLGGSVWIAANGEPQLRTKTFPEISKWVMRGINSHWFEINSMSIQPAKWFKELIESPIEKGGLGKSTKYYYASGQLWSEENPDAFAGAHNWDGEMYIFDEASGIPDAIWTVAEGVFTEDIADRFWFSFSNPRKNTGAFFECFHKNREKWRHRQIDSRTVEGINVQTFQNIIDQYGVDSDEARIEVYGEFPNAGARQFIDLDSINGAMERLVSVDSGAPLLMGVDVARFGEDRSVIAFRQGRDARSIPWTTYRQMDTFQLAGEVAHLANKYKPDAIFVDGGGVGGGVVDALKAMRVKVIEVQAGSSADDKERYKNKRAEMWGRMKEWLKTGCIPNDKNLHEDLRGPEYEWDGVSNQLKLETKEHMKSRGLASPDVAEALAQTFARPIARNDIKVSRSHQRESKVAQDLDYAIFG